MPFLSLNDLTRTEGTATSVHRVRSRGSSLQRRRPTQISHLALTGQPARGAGRGGEETMAAFAPTHKIQGMPDH